MRRTIDAVLFDLDGTLVDSCADIAASVNWALSHSGWPQHTSKDIAQFVGDGMRALVARALGTEEPAQLERTIELFHAHYRAHCLEQTALYPGVTTVLQAWRRKPMAVVTNKPRDLTIGILDGLGIGSYFQVVLGGESLPQKKPHPAPLLASLEQLQVPASRSVMVGDHPNDIRAGQAAGARTCAVTYGLTDAAVLRALQPDLLLDRLDDVLEHFD